MSTLSSIKPSFSGSSKTNLRWVIPSVLCTSLFCFSVNFATAAEEEPTFTPAQKEQINADNAAEAVIKAATARITAKTAFRNAIVAANTPADGNGVTPPTGVISGADNLKFSMYIAALESLSTIAQKVCSDLNRFTNEKFFITTQSTFDANQKYQAWELAIREIRKDLFKSNTDAETFLKVIEKGAIPPTAEQVKAAGLSGAVAAIDILSGGIKGVAGLAALFKTERTISDTENILSAADIAGTLALCGSEKPDVVDLDLAGDAVRATTNKIDNELIGISSGVAELNRNLAKLADHMAKLAEEIAAATEKNDNTKLAELKARFPVGYEDFEKEAKLVYNKGKAFIDTAYTPDATTGLSPLLVNARWLMIIEKMGNSKQLVITSLKSGGNGMTKKSLFFSDKVSFSGGAAIRVQVQDSNGKSSYDQIFYRQSGWIPVDLHEDKGTTLPMQNWK